MLVIQPFPSLPSHAMLSECGKSFLKFTSRKPRGGQKTGGSPRFEHGPKRRCAGLRWWSGGGCTAAALSRRMTAPAARMQPAISLRGHRARCHQEGRHRQQRQWVREWVRIEPQRSSEGGDCTAAATAAQPHPGTAQIGTLKRSSSTARHNPSHSDAAQMPWPLLRAGDVQGPRTSSAWFFPRGYRWTKCSRSRTASPCCGCACVRSRARGVCVCM